MSLRLRLQNYSSCMLHNTELSFLNFNELQIALDFNELSFLDFNELLKHNIPKSGDCFTTMSPP